jgi:hypothetical protein
VSAFLIKRGRYAQRGRAHAHLARYDASGQIVGSFCGFNGYDMSSNVPWGLKQCKHCLRRWREAVERPAS